MDETDSADGFNETRNPLERFGADVRRVRLGRKLTQKNLGRATGYSEGYVSMVEAGKLRASEKFASGCDLAFGTNGLFSGMLRRIDDGEHPSWFAPYLNLEQKASRLLVYSANLVMGMLQTERYARAVFQAAHPREDPRVIDGWVAARLMRSRVFERKPPPDMWIIFHEGCLRTRVGGAEVMAEQLEHLLTLAGTPQIDLQVLPFSAGAAAGHLLPYTLLMFENSPPVLYSDGPRCGRLYDSASIVPWGVDNYDRLRANALSLDDSMVLLKSLQKELQHEC